MRLANMTLGLIAGMLIACDQTPSQQDQSQHYLQEQAQQQGYPTLIATPAIADYALPFCEKKYCIDVEIFAFNSQDQWFNQYTHQQIADLIRQQLGLSQKLSLQQAVDQFISHSDLWLTENPDGKPWTMYIKPRVAIQQDALVLLVINTEYQLGEQHIAAQNYFYILDRKIHKAIRLYDLIKADQRIAFSQMLQSRYQDWQLKLSDEDKQQLAEKLYWANQDWFFDEQGIAVYYRAKDLGVSDAEDLTIYLTPQQMQQWIRQEYLTQLGLSMS